MSAFFDTLRAGLTTFFDWVPNLIGAAVILLLGWLIAKLIAGVVRRVLQAVGLNRLVERGAGLNFKQRYWPSLNIPRLLAAVVFWFIFLIALLLALDALQIATLTAMITAIVAYIPNVIVAILIMIAAFFIAGVIRAIIMRLAGGTFFGKALATAAPGIVIAIGGFMALTQLRIATPIVISTYIIVLAAAGLAFALAFGLGGRGVAQRVLEESYEKGRRDAMEAKPQAQVGEAGAAAAEGASRLEAGPGSVPPNVPPPTSSI
jgi:hypothetical protein